MSESAEGSAGPTERPGEEEASGAAAREARLLLLALTLAAMAGVFIILLPYLHAIILALLLASVFGPAHRLLLVHTRDVVIRKWKLLGRENIAAFCSVLMVSLLVIVPVSLFAGALVKQGYDTFQAVHDWVSEGNLQKALESPQTQKLLNHPHLERLKQLAEKHLEGFDVKDLDLTGTALSVSRRVLEFTGKRILPVLQKTGSLLFGFFIMLFVMFYAFRDGSDTLAYILHLSPLTASEEEALIQRIKDVSRAALLGTLVTAVAQGIAGMIGFWIVGIPALFWGTMLGAASIIPAVGTGLVWAPAVGYLLITGHWGAALFLFLWCFTVVGSIDNLLRPILMGGSTGMSTAVIFFAILGGIQCFGLIGIIYGPLIFGLCAVCFYIYELENSEFLTRQDAV